MDQYGDDIPSPSPPAPAMKKLVAKGEISVATDDDGYHTPTSPKHRIPAALKCPPAPKKKLVQRPHLRRKLSNRGIGYRRRMVPTTPAVREEVMKDDDCDNGFHTPRSPQDKIPPVLKCPPAPKKRLRPANRRRNLRNKIQ